MLLLTSRTHTDNDLRVSAPTLTSPGNQRLMLGLAGKPVWLRNSFVAQRLERSVVNQTRPQLIEQERA